MEEIRKEETVEQPAQEKEAAIAFRVRRMESAVESQPAVEEEFPATEEEAPMPEEEAEVVCEEPKKAGKT